MRAVQEIEKMRDTAATEIKKKVPSRRVAVMWPPRRSLKFENVARFCGGVVA